MPWWLKKSLICALKILIQPEQDSMRPQTSRLLIASWSSVNHWKGSKRHQNDYQKKINPNLTRKTMYIPFDNGFDIFEHFFWFYFLVKYQS